MKLNTLKPAEGAKKDKVRLGRGIGSGMGKTCGRGHKGALARAGGGRRLGFEGGQMPIQRRIPKSGFNSKIAKTVDEIRLEELLKIKESPIDMDVLHRYHYISSTIVKVKVIGNSPLTESIHLKGLFVTKGAKASIEAAGGKVEE